MISLGPDWLVSEKAVAHIAAVNSLHFGDTHSKLVVKSDCL